MNNDDIRITAQPLIDDDICIFRVDRPIFPGGSVDCKNAETAKGSPLLEALFALPNVREVFVAGDSVTVAKQGDGDWRELAKQIGETIRTQIRSGATLISPDLKKPVPSDEEIKRAVHELFDTELNPAIAAHGGHVELVDVSDATVYLRLSGGCQGCASASMTLKYGIERAIRHRIPEILDVVDVTDHDGGANPYYH